MDLDQMGFDRYQRFKFTAELIDRLAEGRSLSILDVGSFDQAMAGFVPGHRLETWEPEVSPARGGLPHAEGSVQVVTALDVLEHVAPGQRGFFIAELARVAAEALIIGFPIAPAAAAERLVLELTNSPWLAEHQAHGLPDPAEVEAVFDELGLGFQRHPNASLASWTAMMLLMYGVDSPELRGRISAFFNRNFYELENREPAYRYIYLCRPAAG